MGGGRGFAVPAICGEAGRKKVGARRMRVGVEGEGGKRDVVYVGRGRGKMSRGRGSRGEGGQRGGQWRRAEYKMNAVADKVQDRMSQQCVNGRNGGVKGERTKVGVGEFWRQRALTCA